MARAHPGAAALWSSKHQDCVITALPFKVFFIFFPRRPADQWKNMSKALTGAGHSLVAVQDNLIDVVWTDRPERPSTQLRTLGLEYTGE